MDALKLVYKVLFISTTQIANFKEETTKDGKKLQWLSLWKGLCDKRKVKEKVKSELTKEIFLQKKRGFNQTTSENKTERGITGLQKLGTLNGWGNPIVLTRPHRWEETVLYILYFNFCVSQGMSFSEKEMRSIWLSVNSDNALQCLIWNCSWPSTFH